MCFPQPLYSSFYQYYKIVWHNQPALICLDLKFPFPPVISLRLLQLVLVTDSLWDLEAICEEYVKNKDKKKIFVFPYLILKQIMG